jgi:hypothetical protein
VSSSVLKPGIKIGQKRIFSDTPNQLTQYSWENFLHEVVKLLNTAKARYPEIPKRIMAHDASSPDGPTTSNNLNVITDNLRELAAAANAMQGDNAAGMDSNDEKLIVSKSANEAQTSQQASTSTPQIPGTIPQVQLDSVTVACSEPICLPRYTIKTVGPHGWEYIDNAEQWTDLLLRRSQEVWTDGVVNMIVEMVNVPVGVERAVRLQGPNVEKRDEAITDDGLPLGGTGN